MAPPRPNYHLDLNSLPPLLPPQNRSNSSTANSSPVEAGQQAGSRLSTADTSANILHGVGNRIGAGSPSHEYGSRFYPSRRARELASEGNSSRAMWGPPVVASGLSTPLRETIPESPGDDGADTFPDFTTVTNEPSLPLRSASLRRNRAGTVPSKPGAPSSSQATPASLSSRPTPSTSPFKPGSSGLGALGRSNSSSSVTAKSALLSRIRAGSLPHRSKLASTPSSVSPFGSGIFSSNYKPPRDRASTHSGVSQEPTSPSQSGFWETGFADTDIKTLDYLGLADRPPQTRPSRAESIDMFNTPTDQQAMYPFLANLNSLNRSANRFRSYSVNAKEKYAAEEDNDMDHGAYYSGTLTPSQEHLVASIAQMQAEIFQHNAQVQAFANRASSSRPRARTAGVLDSPSAHGWRGATSQAPRFGSGLSSDVSQTPSMVDYAGLTDAMTATSLRNGLQGDLASSEEATKSLWLGGIPKSTTESSLRVIFEPYGIIASTKVLPEKNCAFVNFETVESAARAKFQVNGTEIFPGAGPVRIGYAKSRNSSEATASAPTAPSISPDPFVSIPIEAPAQSVSGSGTGHGSTGAAPDATMPFDLASSEQEILEIVQDFGTSQDDQKRISAFIQQALTNDDYFDEIPPVPEPNHNRMHDAPRLRDIRKRIDTNACTTAEVEAIAMNMLPEIAELSSDYIGNTVVQKLFEHCSEPVKEAMLEQIAPHLAEVGVHKNGTWAAQKIIDLARTPAQMNMIVQSIRPYGMAAFHDQYGNYVMQCCLKFSLPWNSFIFEVMLSRLWDLAQGRFGARAMRACLESHHASKDQQKLLAAAIALHSVQLATNANGALLLTWFLDTCNFPNRRKVLAPRLIPHLVYLCTHKVAYLTVVKIINQKNEPEARDMLVRALFFSTDDSVLEEILKDQACGAQFIYKVITTPIVVDSAGTAIQENIRKVLVKINAQASQGYKRLMDEVGLPTRGTNGASRDAPAPQKQREANGFQSSPSKFANGQNQPTAFDRQGVLPAPQAAFGAGFAGGAATPLNNESSMLSNGGGMALPAQMYAGNLGMATPTSIGQSNAMQYQQGMYGSGRAPNSFNFPATPMSGFASPGVSPMDPYRGTMGGRNEMGGQQAMQMGGMGQGTYGQGNNFGTPMGMVNGRGAMWNQYGGGYMVPQQAQQGGGAGGAMGASPRSRVSEAPSQPDGRWRY